MSKKKPEERKEKKSSRSRTSKKRVIGSAGAGLTLLAVLAAAMVSTGTVMAAIGPAMGGFTASFDQVSGGQGATIYPSLGQTAQCGENTPLLSASIPSANAQGITFEKTIQAPSEAPGSIHNVTLEIQQNDPSKSAELNGLNLQLEGLNSSSVTLGGGQNGSVGIYDNATQNTSAAYGNNGQGFSVSAQGNVSISGGKAVADLVTFNGATFNSGLKINLKYNNNDTLNRKDICN
ncbi:MAG: hypothetical protein ABEK59_13050 [Halobacteria archaeon]